MRIVHKQGKFEATCTGPNMHGIGEMIVQYDDGSADSDFIASWTAKKGGDEALREFLKSKER